MKKLIMIAILIFACSVAQAQQSPLLESIHASNWSRMTNFGLKATVFEGHPGGNIYFEQNLSILSAGVNGGYNVESSHGYVTIYVGAHAPIGIPDIYLNVGGQLTFGEDDTTWLDAGKTVEIGYRVQLDEYLSIGAGHEWRYLNSERDAMFFLNLSLSRHNWL
jgi:hypothetical protein